MKVAELKGGMILRLAEASRLGHLAWIVNDDLPLPSGDSELRFAPEPIASLVPGCVLHRDELIVYLGSDKTLINSDEHSASYKQLLRRVLVGSRIVVVTGHNFRYLEPHPEFN